MASRMARDTAPRLALADVACRRGGRLLFAGLSLILRPGESALASGPNGVGKSSLLRLAAGLLPAYAGAVARRGGASLADDRVALDPDRPLAAALGFWANVDGRGDSVDDAMDAFGLHSLSDVPVRMLSAGQRKRAALARTAISGAALWLLDEPANALDAAAVEQLGRVVKRHLAGGGAVLAASHQPLPWRQAHHLPLAGVDI